MIYGIAIAQPLRVSMNSTFMKTHLFDEIYPIGRVHLEVRIGENSPCIFLDQAKLDMLYGWNLGQILHKVMSQEYYTTIMSAKAARKYRAQLAKPGWLNRLNESRMETLGLGPIPRYDHLYDEDILKHIASGAAFQDDCFARLHETPRGIIRKLEQVLGCTAKLYFSPEKGPTFWLNDTVVPSLEDWADIEAGNSGA